MTCAGRDFNGIGNHFEGAVGCEVEDIAVTFRETVFIARRLNAENSLEISFSGGRVGAGEVQDGSPFRDGDAGREFAARKGNGVVVSFDSVLNFFKGVGGLVVGIAITRDVDNLEMLKNFVAFKKFAKGFTFLDARNNPKGMAEHFAEICAGEGIIIIVGLDEQI